MSKEVKQVIVMRNDLNMRKGKMTAQGAHAAMSCLINNTVGKKMLNQWLDGGQTKICVRVDSEEELLEVYRKAYAAGLTVHMITDAGRTEFGGVPTKTCLAVGPNYAEDVDKITGDLKLL